LNINRIKSKWKGSTEIDDVKKELSGLQKMKKEEVKLKSDSPLIYSKHGKNGNNPIKAQNP
jgi:hypothetical protein